MAIDNVGTKVDREIDKELKDYLDKHFELERQKRKRRNMFMVPFSFIGSTALFLFGISISIKLIGFLLVDGEIQVQFSVEGETFIESPTFLDYLSLLIGVVVSLATAIKSYKSFFLLKRKDIFSFTKFILQALIISVIISFCYSGFSIEWEKLAILSLSVFLLISVGFLMIWVWGDH